MNNMPHCRRLLFGFIALTLFLMSFQVLDIYFEKGRRLGELVDAELEEVSGLLASRSNEGYFWVHNDSGDEARFFLLDSTAQKKATYYLQGVKAVDWEDMGYLTLGDKHYLLLGDIGDNGARRPFVQVHMVEEPVYRAGKMVDTIAPSAIKTYSLRYPDGARDAESLFYDPIDQQLYIISKRDLQAQVYRTPLLQAQDTLVLQRCATLPYTFLTGADIAQDGSEVLVKDLLHVYYWKRQGKEPLPALFARKGEEQPYEPETQGEAIAFGTRGEGYYTLGERPFGLSAYLMAYARRGN
ncbi:hypothetical protein [Olivibacter sitiensis]|uniref:hypothetical protein n=1 Tax=Olivibacter sitiensis TaxID=376470 RepID=UPI00042A34CE|nr:hypothetical protein [Olivibacter sitiensis]